MKDHVHKSGEKRHWRILNELPQDVLEAWCKPEKAINPVAIVATVDSDGYPRTAPFGSFRVVTPRLLRLISFRHHDTYKNLSRDGRVMVALVSPPDIAVSIRGHARIVREKMHTDERYAVVDIDVEEVKNDMVRTVAIESAITISAWEEFREWFNASLGEVEEM